MSDLMHKLGYEAECLQRDLSNLPWWAHALVAVLAFVLFLLIATAAVIL